MIRVAVIEPGHVGTATRPRRRFGLDTPLPADPRIVERAILRHLSTCHPDAVVLGLTRAVDNGPAEPAGRVSIAAGVPGLMILLPAGRAAFLLVKTQASTLSRAERAFADLCRSLTVPVHVVRSLPEARRAFDHLGLTFRLETSDESKENRLARRPA